MSLQNVTVGKGKEKRCICLSGSAGCFSEATPPLISPANWSSEVTVPTDETRTRAAVVPQLSGERWEQTQLPLTGFSQAAAQQRLPRASEFLSA